MFPQQVKRGMVKSGISTHNECGALVLLQVDAEDTEWGGCYGQARCAMTIEDANEFVRRFQETINKATKWNKDKGI